jgi:hypothetical protein
MKSILITLIVLTSVINAKSQNDILGTWEIVKIAYVKGDTVPVAKNTDIYKKYTFNYNSTFMCYHGPANREASGKWLYIKKESIIKIRSHTYSNPREILGDYDIQIAKMYGSSFTVAIFEKKKIIGYYIYKKMAE